MLKKILVTGFALATTAAFAQVSTSLVANNGTDPANGVDAATFSRATHFTYDLRGQTTGADWTGSEVGVDVVGPGAIWHATDGRNATQTIVQGIADGDPNRPPGDPDDLSCYLHNLNSPQLANDNAGRNNTRMWDTFFTSPGTAFTIDPSFASPGVPNPNPNQCPAGPPIVSTASRIRGINPQGNEILLAWFDTVNSPLNNTTLARFTFEVAPGDGLSLEQTPEFAFVFARVAGKTTSATNPTGTEFAFTIYNKVPEPSTLALLALGGLAGLIRRR